LSGPWLLLQIVTNWLAWWYLPSGRSSHRLFNLQLLLGQPPQGKEIAIIAEVRFIYRTRCIPVYPITICAPLPPWFCQCRTTI